jgi:hypothetical protein
MVEVDPVGRRAEVMAEVQDARVRHRDVHRDAGLRSPGMRRRHTAALFARRRWRPVCHGVDVLGVVPVADPTDDARARMLPAALRASRTFLRRGAVHLLGCSDLQLSPGDDLSAARRAHSGGCALVNGRQVMCGFA